jgi:hypothetical protein
VKSCRCAFKWVRMDSSLWNARRYETRASEHGPVQASDPTPPESPSDLLRTHGVSTGLALHANPNLTIFNRCLPAPARSGSHGHGGRGIHTSC